MKSNNRSFTTPKQPITRPIHSSLTVSLTTKQYHWLEFLRALTIREIKARYKHAVLGFLWVVLNPALQMIVLGAVFQFFVPVKVDNYFLYLFTGLLPWMFFSLSVSKATPSIVFERALIQKANFPREVIVLAIVLSNLFHFAVSMFLLIVLLIADKAIFEHYSLINLALYSARMLMVIPIMVWLAIVAAGVSLLTSALNVKYRDVNFIVQALMPLWFYATPIIYSLQLLPDEFHQWLYLNPLTVIIQAFQWVLLKQPIASLDLALMSFVIPIVIIYAGVWVFNEEKKWFDDWF